MKKNFQNHIVLVILAIFFAGNLSAQVSCSGSLNLSSSTCQLITVGNGTAGSIEICISNNSIAGGGGSSCNPGGCGPYSGGGWSPRVAIYASNGTTYTGSALANFTSTTANGTCYTVSTTNGYATIIGICSTTGTTISWSTVNTCGDNVCSGTPPACGGPVCTTCAGACPACGFTTNPTVAQVTSSCPDYPFSPEIATGESATRCASFTAVNTTVNFNVIISSTCGSGNVSAFSWTLQSSSCGSTLQSGTLSSLTFTGLTIGASYVYCYTFTVPNPGPPTGSCTHSTHYPYFVGAAPLPIELVSFEAQPKNNKVHVSWTTATESNNDFFTLEKSQDGLNFEIVGTIKGAGNSNSISNYEFIDEKPFKGTSYYRLKQTDFDGEINYSGITTAYMKEESINLIASPNPASDKLNLNFNSYDETQTDITVFDLQGRPVISESFKSLEGNNSKDLDILKLSPGFYYIVVQTDGNLEKTAFIKSEN